MNKYLTSIVEKEGIGILKNPSQLCQLLKSQMDSDSAYPFQMELLLESTEIGELVQIPDNLKCQGYAAYQAIVMRAVAKTGFTIETVNRLIKDILNAAGIKIKDIYLTKLQETEKIQEILDKDGNELRGESAFRRAVIFLNGNVNSREIRISDTNEIGQRSAFKLFERAARDGYHKAYGALAICYYNGIGTEVDYQEAWRCAQMPGALESNYVKQIRVIYENLYDMQKAINKKKWMAIFLSVVVVLAVLLINMVIGLKFRGIFLLLLTVISCVAGIYKLIVQHGNLKTVQKSIAVSLLLWVFTLVVCIGV